jgi:hypothetical protein
VDALPRHDRALTLHGLLLQLWRPRLPTLDCTKQGRQLRGTLAWWFLASFFSDSCPLLIECACNLLKATYRRPPLADRELSPQVRKFTSPPAAGPHRAAAAPQQPTKLVALSDMGEFNWSAPTLARLATSDYDLLLHNGDISYADNRLHINQGAYVHGR